MSLDTRSDLSLGPVLLTHSLTCLASLGNSCSMLNVQKRELICCGWDGKEGMEVGLTKATLASAIGTDASSCSRGRIQIPRWTCGVSARFLKHMSFHATLWVSLTIKYNICWI